MRLLSLFSGCGGMDIGFEGGFTCLKRSINENLHSEWIEQSFGNKVRVKKTPFDTIFANDINAAAKVVWTSYFNHKTKSIYHLDSIVNLVKTAKNGQKIFPDNVDIVTGGFPCQDFSIAGKRTGFNSRKSHTGEILKTDEPSIENRGQLYWWMREVINITKPKMFIAENVKGLISLADIKTVIENDFARTANNGYIIAPVKILHSANYGVPQSRERIFFFGFKKSALTNNAQKALSNEIIPEKYNPYPLPTHAYTIEKFDLLYEAVTCAEAFDGLDEPDRSNDLSQQKYSKAKYMGKHCQGQIEVKLNSIAPTIRSEHHGNIEYRRLSKEHGGMHTEELKNNMIERRLTVRECARLQTFPDEYQFIIPKNGNNKSVPSTDAYKLIGNAVPCVLAYNIAMHISDNWNLYFGD